MTPAATMMIPDPNDAPVILVTGAARRVGAEIARQLHATGARLALHYRNSAGEAEALAAALNALRADSAFTVGGDLGRAGVAEEVAASTAWSTTPPASSPRRSAASTTPPGTT
jgi:pteridine reductase